MIPRGSGRAPPQELRSCGSVTWARSGGDRVAAASTAPYSPNTKESYGRVPLLLFFYRKFDAVKKSVDEFEGSEAGGRILRYERSGLHQERRHKIDRLDLD